jgi:deoxyribonuclease V
MGSQSWICPQTVKEAKAAQQEMASLVITEDTFPTPLTCIGGMDVSSMPFDSEKKIFGAVTVLDYNSLELIEHVEEVDVQTFPYIPGLLGFREIPILVKTYHKLSKKPDVIMVDGHGVSHPRGLGVATHLGVFLDVPTIGVAKSILVGSLAENLSEEVGSMTPLIWKGKEIGMALRTKKRCKPLFISAGYKISLQSAVSIVLRSLRGYRLPEPTRKAHLMANHYRVQLAPLNTK